jgi:cytochrome c-type biogenesis protein CcmF
LTSVMGNLVLFLAMLASVSAAALALASVRLESARLLTLSRRAMIAAAGGFMLAAMALMLACINSDFHLEYVAKFTDRVLPGSFKMAAFWAGQEGSILLWGLMIAVMAVIATTLWRQRPGKEYAVAAAALGIVCGFFAALLLFAANPFTLNEVIPDDGRGLNPLLQHAAMVFHPPALFLGYAGFTVPFALMLGIVAVRRADSEWLWEIRRWVLAAWLFLSVGILLGAEWAYVELGWGGYWAWDPVENASLLPWLTATALLHSMFVQQHRGMFKLWNVSLLASTFLLCVFGTYITRSGVVESVHAFGKSLIGTFFLLLLVSAALASIVLIVRARKSLLGERPPEVLVSREGFVLAGNVLLVLMTLATLVGTIFPVFSGLVSAQPVSVGVGFYNKVVVPPALVLLAMMAVAPVLGYGAKQADLLAGKLAVPAIAALVAAAALWLRGVDDLWALACAAIVAAGLVSIILDFLLAVRKQTASSGESALRLALRTIDANHRRYGGQVAHIGMLLILAGMAGSSLFSRKGQVETTAGQVVATEAGKLNLRDLMMVKGGNYEAVRALVTLTEANGNRLLMAPERRFYNQDESNSQVAIDSNWRRDIYIVLSGWDHSQNGNSVVSFQVIVNPLVSWIWLGGFVLAAGALIGLSPQVLRRAEVADAEKQKTVEARRHAGTEVRSDRAKRGQDSPGVRGVARRGAR